MNRLAAAAAAASDKALVLRENMIHLPFGTGETRGVARTPTEAPESSRDTNMARRTMPVASGKPAGSKNLRRRGAMEQTGGWNALISTRLFAVFLVGHEAGPDEVVDVRGIERRQVQA